MWSKERKQFILLKIKQVQKYVRIRPAKRSENHRSWISLYLYREKTNCDGTTEYYKHLGAAQGDTMATGGRTKPCSSGELCLIGRGYFSRGSFFTSPKFNRDTYAESQRFIYCGISEISGV
ncbi:hypothetical protein PoB_003771700 [Plakobranchus ocellatus]|uniref:Uncharacterized protein n=1 Tax=Plakobranchus ocellatus TaxID=259542 RepID=A0AAV4AV86_9GAST|nr:hypothetical protein PoB_003771700 [Plakobranchus ocellatus]